MGDGMPVLERCSECGRKLRLVRKFVRNVGYLHQWHGHASVCSRRRYGRPDAR